MKFRADFVTNSSSSSFISIGIRSKKLVDFIYEKAGKKGKNDIYYSTDLGGMIIHDDIISITERLEDIDVGPYYLDCCLDDWYRGDSRTDRENRIDERRASKNETIAKCINLYLSLTEDADKRKLLRLTQESKRNKQLRVRVEIMETDDFEYTEFYEDDFPEIPQVSARKTPSAQTAQKIPSFQEIISAQNSDKNKSSTGNRCKNLTFVITGKVYSFTNRAEFTNYVEAQGGRVSGSVSIKTNYLVNNDITSDSSKNNKAKELNIPIISELEFIEKFVK